MIYVINRFDGKAGNVKNYSGYEQIIKNSEVFRTIKGNKFISKIIFKLIGKKKPKNYHNITYSKEIIILFKVLFTGKPIFYLYADKDAYIIPILKRKLNLKNIKIFGTLHWPFEISQDFSFYKNNLEKEFNGIICLSSSLNKGEFVKYRKIPHGIDLDFWSNNKSGFKNQYLILGISNRNHIDQIKVIKAIQDIDRLAVFKILISNKKIRSLYGQLNNTEIISSRIHDLELKKLYSQSKAVILVQNHCLASNVVLESMAMQVPIITNNIGDIAEYLGENYPLFVNIDYLNESLSFFENTNWRESTSNYLGKLKTKYEWKEIRELTVKFITKNSK